MQQSHTLDFKEKYNTALDASQLASKSIAELNEDLSKIFTHYCEYSEELKDQHNTKAGYLKDSNYRKLLLDCSIIKPTPKDKNAAYLIFLTYSQGKKFLSYDNFKSSLLKIAEMKYPDIYAAHPKVALLKVIENISGSVVQRESNSLIIGDTSDIGIDITSSTAILISSIYGPLRTIYHSYFFIPLKKIKKLEDLPNLLPKLTYTFLRDFSICPDIISKQKALSLLEEVLAIQDMLLLGSAALIFSTKGKKKKCEDYGNYFTLKRFIHYLIYVSTVGFAIKKLTSQSYTVTEQFFYILTKMELSSGFQRLQKIGTKFSFNSLIPAQSVLQQIILNNPMDFPEQKDAVKKERFIEKEMMALDLFSDKLRRIFLWYCSIGTSSDSNQLTIVKYIKLLKDAGIIGDSPKAEGTIMKNEAEIVYSRVISTKNNRKLNIDDEDIHSALRNPKLGNALIGKSIKQAHLEYEDFIYALSIIAHKLYPNINPDKALVLIAENVYIITLEPTQNK
jgi:hypothetical protein